MGAIGKDGLVTSYSSRGTNGLDLVAFGGHDTNLFPITIDNCLVGRGGDIFSTDRMNNLGYNDKPITTGIGYSYNQNYTEFFNGTSAACPQVSGAVALMLSIRPNLTETQITDILRNTATKINGQANFSDIYGYGRLNVGAALQATNNSQFGMPITPAVSNYISACSQIFTVNSTSPSVYTWTIPELNIYQASYSFNWLTVPLSDWQGLSQITVTCVINDGCSNLTSTQVVTKPIIPNYCSANRIGYANLTAYPNPSSDHLTLSWQENKTPFEIGIYNLFGEQVLSLSGSELQNIRFDLKKNESSLPLKIIGLSNGIYVVKMNLGDEVLTTKIMIQKGKIAD